MRTETIALAIFAALMAALYGSYPEECNEVAGALGRAILRVAGPSAPGLPSSSGETALMRYSASGGAAAVAMLLEQGAEANLQDKDGNTALMRASQNGHDEVVRLLLENGADPNIQTHRGGTALMHASFNGHVSVVRQLLAVAADTRLKDDFDGTALMRAANRGHTEVVRTLLQEVSLSTCFQCLSGSERPRSNARQPRDVCYVLLWVCVSAAQFI
jgi:hypothetical protein